MSEKQHAKDLKDLKDKHKAVEEACLNRHISEFKENETCSHRGQAYKKASGEGAGLYNYPAYKELVDRGERISTAANRGKKTIPSWYKPFLKAPKKGDWNVDKGKNFKHKCYTPYWHESHHVVPNSTLRAAITDTGKGAKNPSKMVLVIRGGLLDEGYNINNLVNMIILPMDREVSRAIALPKHRRTPEHRSHSAYSTHVRDELKKILRKIRASSKKHEPPKYKKCRKQIELLSKRLYKAIIQAGKDMKEAAGKDDSLDDMEAERFGQKSSKASKPGARPKKAGSKAGGRPTG